MGGRVFTYSLLGSHLSIQKILENRLFELRGKHPRWTLACILGRLIEVKLWNMVNPSRATICRFETTANP
jgi:putative transposase